MDRKEFVLVRGELKDESIVRHFGEVVHSTVKFQQKVMTHRIRRTPIPKWNRRTP